MKDKGQLQEFWAVTKGGVYHVTARKDEQGFPIVEKIQSHRENEKAPVGMRLKAGGTVAVAKIGIFLFNQGFCSRLPEAINTRYWGGGTSPVIGLFLNRRKALDLQRRKQPLLPCDPRWQKDTLAVLEAIGDNHDVFVISQFDDMCIAKAYGESS